MRTRRPMVFVIAGVTVAAFALLCLFLTMQTTVLAEKPFKSDSARGIYKRAAVAADNGVCSDIGRGILEKGGNAVESIIATAICIGVMDPHSSGLGGGHFLTVYLKDKKSCFILDARETAPLSVDVEAYKQNVSLSRFGWMSIAVPGEIHGFWTAYQKFGGNIPWKDLWTPTIDLCRNGVTVSPAVDQILKERAADIVKNPDFTDYVNKTTGKLVVTNDVIKLPLLAETMEILANSTDPVKTFYDSEWTEKMVEEFQNNGGIITREDMRAYRTKFGDNERPPVLTKLSNDLTFCTPPPPSSASLVTAILNILDSFNMSTVDSRNSSQVALLFHRFIEAAKFAYGARGEMGDVDFVKEALHLAQQVNDPSFGQATRDKIHDRSFADPNFYGLDAGRPDHGTAHMSIVDQFGNAASLTSSINYYFGARVRSKVTGIIYNDEMDDFSIKTTSNIFEVAPTRRNRMEPGKRPQSSMSPVVGFDPLTGQVRMVLGAAGGIKIIAATAQVVMRLLYLNETIKQAIDAPRIYHQLIPYKATYENKFPQEIITQLNNKHGQETSSLVNTFFSVVCGINRLSNGYLEANSDYRKGGGYTAGF